MVAIGHWFGSGVISHDLSSLVAVGGLATKTSVDMAELKSTKDQLAKAHADIK